jgi:hypothetical protein
MPLVTAIYADTSVSRGFRNPVEHMLQGYGTLGLAQPVFTAF